MGWLWFQTCKTYWFKGVNKGSEVFDTLLTKIVNYKNKNINEAYEIFAAGEVLTQEAEYQSCQKTDNCQLESFMAFLKKNLGTNLYIQYRIQLIIDTLDELKKNPEKPIELIERLETMKENRIKKMSSRLTVTASPPPYLPRIKN